MSVTRPNVFLVMADAHFLPLKDACFDVVVAYGVLSCLADPKKGVLEIRRVLRRGGLLVGYDLNSYAATNFVEFAKRLLATILPQRRKALQEPNAYVPSLHKPWMTTPATLSAIIRAAGISCRAEVSYFPVLPERFLMRVRRSYVLSRLLLGLDKLIRRVGDLADVGRFILFEGRVLDLRPAKGSDLRADPYSSR